jgi:hypothetical protein
MFVVENDKTTQNWMTLEESRTISLVKITSTKKDMLS